MAKSLSEKRFLMLMKQLSCLPEPKYNPRIPKERTLAAVALRLMSGGAKVAHPDFEAVTGSWRLAAHVHILRRLGWPVLKEEKPMAPCDDTNHERSYALYYLSPDLLDIIKGV